VLPHHEETVKQAVALHRGDHEALALLLGGSLAHGYAVPESDVDVMVVVPDERFEERRRTNRTMWYSPEMATYAEGYVDVKFVSPGYMKLLADEGSEPARFAFKDARVRSLGFPGSRTRSRRSFATRSRARRTACAALPPSSRPGTDMPARRLGSGIGTCSTFRWGV
jgi:predicted nucleotidyltransferase